MFHSQNEGLETPNINTSDVYSVLLTILMSETQTGERLLTLQTACSLCKMVCHGEPLGNELCGAFCAQDLFPRCD